MRPSRSFVQLARGSKSHFLPTNSFRRCLSQAYTQKTLNPSRPSPWVPINALSHFWFPKSPPTRRYESTASVSHTSPISQAAEGKRDEPAFEMTFTCKRCQTRSTHRVSKQGYNHGTVLITCTGCKIRHLISDHLSIFSAKPVTLEDLMREKGHMIKKGTLSEEGDVEFWDDGTTRRRLESGEGNMVEKEVAARPAKEKQAKAEAGEGGEFTSPGSSFKGEQS